MKSSVALLPPLAAAGVLLVGLCQCLGAAVAASAPCGAEACPVQAAPRVPDAAADLDVKLFLHTLSPGAR